MIAFKRKRRLKLLTELEITVNSTVALLCINKTPKISSGAIINLQMSLEKINQPELLQGGK